MDQSMDIRTRTGGAYIPPAKLRLMQQQISDKNSEQYQRLSWETLKKSINGLINKVNVGNIATIVKELFEINLIRGRGMLVRSLIRAQISSPTFTHVYAALIAVCNTKFPKIGELLLKRLIIQFRRYFQRNDKSNCINTTRFIAHLVNQQIAHEVIALEILILLLENATNDSVEVAIAFLKECGAKLDDVSRKGATAIFERLRNILHEGELNKRVQYMIEVMFAVRKDKFKDHPAVLPELDLIEESEQFTHLMTLEDELDSEDRLNVFQFDEKFQDNEAKYEAIKKDILDADSSDDEDDGDESGSDSGSEDDDDEDGDDGDEKKVPKIEGEGSTMIIDNTETNLITLRKTIYLTIQSSLDFEECAHKLLKLEIQQPQYPELCNMIVDCCAQQRTYIKFFGLLAQRFCMLNHDYVEPFKDIFKNCYDTIHRFETCKLRNVAKLFAHLLHTDAIPWTVLAHIKLNEYDTTSSSRVFIKILFQQLAESLGLVKLNARIKDGTLQEAFEGLFPRDNPQNTRFAINFFTSIGLGGLTDDLREHLKTVANQKPTVQLLAGMGNNNSATIETEDEKEQKKKIKKEEEEGENSSSSSSDDSDSSSDDSSSSSSDSDDSSSDEDSDNRHNSKKTTSKHRHEHQRKDNKKHHHSSSRNRHQSKSNENDRRRRDYDDEDEEEHRKSSKRGHHYDIKEEYTTDEPSNSRHSRRREEPSPPPPSFQPNRGYRNRRSNSNDSRRLKERNHQQRDEEPEQQQQQSYDNRRRTDHQHPTKRFEIKEEIESDYNNRRSDHRSSYDHRRPNHRHYDDEDRRRSGDDMAGGDYNKRRRH